MMYQMDGELSSRCGSLQRMGEPLAVLPPATAQSLLPVSGDDFSIGLIWTKSLGRAEGTLSSERGMNFHPPGLSTMGSPTCSLSGYRRFNVSFPKSRNAFVISKSLSAMLRVFAMYFKSNPLLTGAHGSGQ